MRAFREQSVRKGLAAVVVLLLAGCASGTDGSEGAAPPPGGEAPSASPPGGVPAGSTAPTGSTAPSPAAPEPAEAAPVDTTRVQWTAGVVDERRPAVRMTVLTAVRAARHPGFDRVVFEFQGSEVPGYHLEYVDRPVRQCGSGNAVPVAGDGWLTVRMEPSQAHDDEGRATVQDRKRMLDLPVLRELQSICDFEGQVEWVLGVGSPNRFRVFELKGPARLVVDVRH